MSEVRTLMVVSHVVHYRHQDRLYAYGPYAREIDMWADLFEEVRIASPCHDAPPPGDAIPFTRPNISILPQRETGGTTALAKIRQALLLPWLVRDLGAAMRQVDAVHVRCPGNLGLLGALLAPLFSPYRIAKYAGQWTGYPGEPRSMRLQRALLRSRWWRAPVTVYGCWPEQTSHVVPFFTSMMDEAQLEHARAVVRHRTVPLVPRVLYVGRLSRAKNVHILIAALKKLKQNNIALPCTIVGGGPERNALASQVREAGLQKQVTFVGAVPFERMAEYYERADVLVLASESEGWPKALAEAMAFGLVVVGSNRGLIPWMLDDGRGITVAPGDGEGLAQILAAIAAAPHDYYKIQQRAASWAQQHSLEELRDELRRLLEERWNRPLHPNRSVEAHA